MTYIMIIGKFNDTGAYGDNVEDNYDGHTHAEPCANEFSETTSKSYMDIYHEEKQQKERTIWKSICEL